MKRAKSFRFQNIITLTAVGLGCYCCLRYTEACANGIRKGILFCIEVLVPSLFVFMALSSAVIRSGIAVSMTKPLEKPARILFRLPPPGLAVILLGILGGYPVGARCAEALYEQGAIRRPDAEKTACIAVCAGPGFLLNYVGCALLNSRQAGNMLLICEITGVLITGMIIGRVMKGDRESSFQPSGGIITDNLLISSVTDASRATFRMCGMVVVCTAMTEVIDTISPDRTLTDLTSAFIEITEGCHRMCGVYPLTLIAFFIGFGGISVHLQIYAGLSELRVNKGSFFLFRIMQGMITAAAAYTYLMIFPVEQGVFNSTDAPLTLSRSATLAGSAALVLSAFCFIGSIRRHRLNDAID